MIRMISILFCFVVSVGCSLHASISGNSSNSPKQEQPSPSENNPTPSPTTPSTLGYSLAKTTYSTSESFSLSPSVAGSLSQFSITPNLPSGISIDTNSGQITGSTSNPSALQAYVIKAFDPIGSEVTAQINFEIAITFNVNSTNDLDDVTPGDGVCLTSSSNCSLRAAITEANSQTAGISSIINIPPGTYGLLSQSLTLSSRILLKGTDRNTTIIDANPDATPISPAISILSTSTFASIEGISIKNANLTAPAGNTLGVGIKSLATDIELKNCEITNNSITGSDFSTVIGVGLYHSSSGKFTMDNCIITSNSANLPNASATSTGGGAHIIASSIIVTNSTVSNNSLGTATGASRGGGLAFDGNSVISNSVISNNQARNAAAGIYYIGDYSSEIKYSTLDENNSGSLAFGNFIYVATNADLTISNSTMSKTSGSSPELIYTSTGSQLNIKNSTFVSTTSQIIELNGSTTNIEASTLDSSSDSIYFRLNSGTLYTKSSIYKSASFNCTTHTTPVTSYGYNVFSDSTCNTGNSTDLVNTDALLNSLANNGGVTMTLSTNVSSPARNLVPSTDCLAKDQRDISRSSSTFCDAGAYQH